MDQLSFLGRTRKKTCNKFEQLLSFANQSSSPVDYDIMEKISAPISPVDLWGLPCTESLRSFCTLSSYNK